jgi:hypothetical protein
VGDECVGGRCSVVTDWGRIEVGGKTGRENGGEGAERVVGRENNGLWCRRKRECEVCQNRDKKVVMVKLIIQKKDTLKNTGFRNN